MLGSIKLCTWNIWFSPKYQKKRIIHAMTEIQNINADIICLQEVTKSIIDTILQCSIVNTYQIFYDTYCLSTYAQIFLVNKKMTKYVVSFDSISFPETKMARRFYQLTLANGLIIINVHLESSFTGKDAIIKFLQLKYLFNKYFDKKTIICGDFNMSSTDDYNITSLINTSGFFDIGAQIFTYDCLKNTNINDNFRSRLDRIICNFPCHYENGVPLGQTTFYADQKQIFPSDHFGLVIQINRY